jgi:CheY-like chemotaxis protein
MEQSLNGRRSPLVLINFKILSKSIAMLNSLLVFYIDDDPDDLEFFKESVTSLGHEVATFSDRLTFIQALRNAKQKPDFVFLDVHMPKVNSATLIDEIKESLGYNPSPIILFSGSSAEAPDAKQYMAAGANYLVQKPRSFQEYQTSIKAVFNMAWKEYKDISKYSKFA